MLSSSNIGLELPRDIDSCVNWKTAPKGRRRAVRRGRNSVGGESNSKKTATTSSNGSDNASDEEFKDPDQVLVSESEQLGVTILGRRFSDTIQSVPIKKRMRLLTGSHAPLDSSQISTLDIGSASFVEGSLLDNHVDFSGISMLADAACKSDMPDEDANNFPVSGVQSPKGENGVLMPPEASKVQSSKNEDNVVLLESSSTLTATAEIQNDGSDTSSKSEKVPRDIRLHWDLNTVMDAWDCDQQEGGNVSNCEQRTAAVACNTEVCNHPKEEPEKAGNEDLEVTIRNNGDVLGLTTPQGSFKLHGTDSRKEDDIVTEVNPKDSIVESITPPRNCPVVITPPFGPIPAKEEVDSDNELQSKQSSQLSASVNEQLSMCKLPEIKEIKEEIEGSGSVTDKPLEVNPKLELTTGPELISEECPKDSVTSVPAPGSEPKDALTGNDQAGVDTMIGDYRMDHDSMTGDDKVEHKAMQGNSDQLVEEKNHVDPPHIETGLMPTFDNDEGRTKDDSEMIDQKVDLSLSDKVVVEMEKHGSSLEFHNDGDNSDLYPPKKDQEEDDYQYEDGELREPAMRYWGTDGFEGAETERGPCETDDRGNCLMEAVPGAPVMGSLTLDAHGEERLLVADAGLQIDDRMDTNMIVKMDLNTEGQAERLENSQANNGGENDSGEYMPNSRAKTTGWDMQPKTSRRNSESPLKPESRPGSPSLRGDLSLHIDKPISADDPLRNDKSFIRSKRSREDDMHARDDRSPRASRIYGQGGPSRHPDTSRRDEHWVETGVSTGRTRHRTTEFGAPSYAPSNSGNATAASIAKVQSNGFMVAPDGTLVKASGSHTSRKCQNSSSLYHGSPTERDHRGFGASRERIMSPERFGGTRGGRACRYAVEPARDQYHRPVMEINPGRRSQRSFSPHRGPIRHISPCHIGSPSRSRTRSPNVWVSPTPRVRCLADHEPRHERGRSPLRRVRPDYDDRLGAVNLVHRNQHHVSLHTPRCVNDRRCVNDISPPRNARFHPLDLPPPQLHRMRDEFYHHPVHSGRCNGFDHRRGFEEDRFEMVRPERFIEKTVNGDGFRPRNSSHKASESYRRGSPRGLNRSLDGDVNHRGKEERDNFKFGTGGRRNNGKYEKREMRDRSGNDDDAAARRRLS